MWYTKISVNLISRNDKIKPSDQNEIEPVRKILHLSPRTAKLAGIPIPLFIALTFFFGLLSNGKNEKNVFLNVPVELDVVVAPKVNPGFALLLLAPEPKTNGATATPVLEDVVAGLFSWEKPKD